jgi:hypothetical protein
MVKKSARSPGQRNRQIIEAKALAAIESTASCGIKSPKGLDTRGRGEKFG